MKILKKISLLFVLFFLYAYIVFIYNIPEVISVFEGDQVKISTLWGIKIKKENDVIQTSTNVTSNTFEKAGHEQLTVSLFNKIDVKTIDVNIMEETEVIPSGEIVGIKLYTSGVLVVGTSSIEGIDGQNVKPFQDTGIQEGDSITTINDTIINNTEELVKAVNDAKGEKIKITYIRKGEEKTCEITPTKDKSNEYKIGLWVRDSAAGVGTITFYHEQTNSFAGLGHAITDIDTGEIINTSSGEIDDVKIVSVEKGEKEEPGKIQGTIKDNKIIGNIYKNTEYGIYGVIKDIDNLSINKDKRMKVASRHEIQLGEAKILCGIDDEIKEYKIEIQKIHLNNNYDNKSMLIKVTDEELINKTGGIVQGMSGSPIIQNGKFIGCVTHVFVNDPKIGYAVFGDIMISQLNEIGD
ncbi:MAG: SpoIVB peptidase [Clostridia bacterium]|nr:SpoIVB peptidase [Clostridia bacterium]